MMGLFAKIHNPLKSFRETIKILYYYRLRTFFSLLGVAFGIFSICVIITTIDGANRKAYEIFETLGPDSIMIFSGGERERAMRIRLKTLRVQDAKALEKVNGIYMIVKGYVMRETVRYLDKKWQTRIEGATENLFEYAKWKVIEGSYFTKEDVDEKRNVAVIGYKVYKELFGGENAVGKTILLRRLPIRVVGVLEERGGGVSSHIDDVVVVPITTVMEKIDHELRYLSTIRLKTERDLDETIKDIREVLRKNHGLKPEADDDFTIRTSRDVVQFLSVIKGSLYLFLGTASLIALLVSGFVLSNLFYLSIQDRRKDLGIRRAYGATREGIIFSFLIESVMITICGGLLGIILSYLSKGTLERLFDLPMRYSVKVIILSLIFSFLTGLISGLRPALTASKIPPYEAIRS
jgi:putative ABC transport system permease protein